MAIRQYYCAVCDMSQDVPKYEEKQPQNPNKKDCGCGRKRRKS